MKLFDTHTHLNNGDMTEQELSELVAEIKASNVKKIVNIGFDVPSSILALEQAKKYDFSYAAVGVHPHDTDHMTEDDYNEIKRLAMSSDKVVAIGEIGLDYHYDKEWMDIQKYWFKRQIELSNELKLPMSIHSRDADLDTLNCLLEANGIGDERIKLFSDNIAHVVIHCYSGSYEFSREYINRGCFLGVDGPLTYKNNKKTVEVVEKVPLEYLVIETDAPYLTPVPHRGERNKSPYVELVAEKISEIKGISVEEVAEVTYNNALRLFGIL